MLASALRGDGSVFCPAVCAAAGADTGAERNKALGVWGGLGGIGATAGLLIGGLITSGLGWEWTFFINVPIGLVLLAVSPALLRESRDRAGARALDPAGAVSITAALVLLVYAVFRAPQVGWGSGQTVGLLAGSAALIGVFVAVEARVAAPLVPLRRCGSPRWWAATW